MLMWLGLVTIGNSLTQKDFGAGFDWSPNCRRDSHKTCQHLTSSSWTHHTTTYSHDIKLLELTTSPFLGVGLPSGLLTQADRRMDPEVLGIDFTGCVDPDWFTFLAFSKEWRMIGWFKWLFILPLCGVLLPSLGYCIVDVAVVVVNSADEVLSTKLFCSIGGAFAAIFGVFCEIPSSDILVLWRCEPWVCIGV